MSWFSLSCYWTGLYELWTYHSKLEEKDQRRSYRKRKFDPPNDV